MENPNSTVEEDQLIDTDDDVSLHYDFVGQPLFLCALGLFALQPRLRHEKTNPSHRPLLRVRSQRLRDKPEIAVYEVILGMKATETVSNSFPQIAIELVHVPFDELQEKTKC
mmetsp:Transcript_7275/g.17744  ORF Transcript_7275/g.17744 Transcript_7275/m.17744 type:complete len:112 (-) Transcript_7275:574-909(-)